jgi:hypothetical protein
VTRLLGSTVLLGDRPVEVGEALDVEIGAVTQLGGVPQRVRHDRQDVDAVLTTGRTRLR